MDSFYYVKVKVINYVFHWSKSHCCIKWAFLLLCQDNVFSAFFFYPMPLSSIVTIWFYSQINPYVPKAILSLTFVISHEYFSKYSQNITEAAHPCEHTDIIKCCFFGKLAYSLHFNYSQHIALLLTVF